MRTALTSAMLLLGCGLLAHAQGLSPYFAAVGPGSYHHASTVEEGAQRGMADVIRSSGAANLMNSEAAINIEDARKKYIENRLQATDTYFQMKSINQQYRQSQRRPAPTQEQMVRFSQQRMPDRAGSSELDPLTGELRWPVMLRLDAFKDRRDRLNQLFIARAENGHLNPTQYQEVKEITGQMTQELRQYTTQFTGNDSIEARRFLQTLAYEAGFQAS